MSQIYGDPQLDPPPSANSSQVAAHFDRQGNLIVVDLNENRAVAGKLFAANFGTLSTVIRLLGAGIVDRRPQAWIRVPLNTTIIPLLVEVEVELAGAAVFEMSVLQCSNDVGNGTSAAASIGPVNLNTRLGSDAGQCAARQLASADVDVEVNAVELQMQTYASGVDNVRFRYNPRDSGIVSVLHGPATLALYGGGTDVDCFVKIVWMEFNSALIQV